MDPGPTVGAILVEGCAALPQPDHFRLLATSSTPAAVVQVEGELDLSAVPALRRAVRAAWTRSSDVELDVAGVTFVDCAALGALIGLDLESRGHSCTVRVRNVPAEVRWLFRYFDLDGLVLDDTVVAGAQHQVAE